MTDSATTASPSTARTSGASDADALRRRFTHPLAFRLFLLAKLPLALVAGLRIRRLDAEGCTVTVPYGWRTTNPFRSTYFAVLAMAAEMSTGALALAAVRSAPASVAVIITGLEGEFTKKVQSTAVFTSDDGAAFAAAVARAVATGESVTHTATSVGRLEDGTEIARFRFTWSFKRRG